MKEELNALIDLLLSMGGCRWYLHRLRLLIAAKSGFGDVGEWVELTFLLIAKLYSWFLFLCFSWAPAMYYIEFSTYFMYFWDRSSLRTIACPYWTDFLYSYHVTQCSYTTEDGYINTAYFCSGWVFFFFFDKYPKFDMNPSTQ